MSYCKVQYRNWLRLLATLLLPRASSVGTPSAVLHGDYQKASNLLSSACLLRKDE